MSRINTPTGLGVNPNVPMADMQAPTIVYGAEGMDETGLLQYEQLTNVLQAGVQASGTFLETSIMDRKLKAEISAQSAKLRSDQFRVGLEESIRLDKATQTDERIKYDNVKSYLSEWDYETLGADDQILWQRTLGGYEEKDLEQQRQFNTKALVSVFRTRLDAIRGRAEGGDPEAMGLMSQVKDEQTASELLMDLLNPEERANFETIDSLDRDMYRDRMSVILAQFVQEGSKYSARINIAANERKVAVMGEISANDIADQFVSASDKEDLSDYVLSNIDNIRSVLPSINPTMTESQIDATVGTVLEQTAVSLMERGTPEQILKFRQVVARDDVDIDPTTKGVLLGKLESQAQLRLTNEYEARITKASTNGSIGNLYALREELNAKNPVITDAQRETLRAKADSEMKSLVTAKSKEVVDSRANKILSEATAKTSITDEEIDTWVKSMHDMLDANAFVLQNATDKNGKPIAGVDRGTVLQAIADVNSKLRTMKEQKETLEDNLSINQMVTNVTKELSGVQGEVDWSTVQGDFTRIMESRGIPSDSPEYRKARQMLDSGVRNQFFPAMEQAYVGALNEFMVSQNLPGDRQTLAPEQGDLPPVADEKRRLRGLVNYNRLVWDLNGGSGNARSSIINPLIGAFSATATEGPTSYRVRDAFEIYQLAARNGLPMDDIFGKGPDSRKLQDGMLLISNMMASGMSYEDAIRDSGIQMRFDTSGFLFTDIAVNPQASADKIAYGLQFNGDVQSELGITASNPVMLDSMPWLQRSYASDYSRALAMTHSPDEALKSAGFSMKKNTTVIPVTVNGKTVNSVLPKEMGKYSPDVVQAAAKKLSGGRDDVMFVVTDLINGKPVYALRGVPTEISLQTGLSLERTYVETEYVDTKTYRFEDIFTQELINEHADSIAGIPEMEAAAPGAAEGTVRYGYERATQEEIQQGEAVIKEMSKGSYGLRSPVFLGDLETQIRLAQPNIQRANRLMELFGMPPEQSIEMRRPATNQVNVFGERYFTDPRLGSQSFNP